MILKVKCGSFWSVFFTKRAWIFRQGIWCSLRSMHESLHWRNTAIQWSAFSCQLPGLPGYVSEVHAYFNLSSCPPFHIACHSSIFIRHRKLHVWNSRHTSVSKKHKFCPWKWVISVDLPRLAVVLKFLMWCFKNVCIRKNLDNLHLEFVSDRLPVNPQQPWHVDSLLKSFKWFCIANWCLNK